MIQYDKVHNELTFQPKQKNYQDLTVTIQLTESTRNIGTNSRALRVLLRIINHLIAVIILLSSSPHLTKTLEAKIIGYMQQMFQFVASLVTQSEEIQSSDEYIDDHSITKISKHQYNNSLW